MEKIYCDALDRAKEAFDQISTELPEEAQYIVPMAYNIHWYFHVSLRELIWMCELRSSPQDTLPDRYSSGDGKAGEHRYAGIRTIF
jgi:thymidylate synthase ThyX